jgi:hypothetical protein
VIFIEDKEEEKDGAEDEGKDGSNVFPGIELSSPSYRYYDCCKGDE